MMGKNADVVTFKRRKNAKASPSCVNGLHKYKLHIEYAGSTHPDRKNTSKHPLTCRNKRIL